METKGVLDTVFSLPRLQVTEESLYVSLLQVSWIADEK
jgi:hypothetical protein